jgi:hypothetical protein
MAEELVFEFLERIAAAEQKENLISGFSASSVE